MKRFIRFSFFTLIVIAVVAGVYLYFFDLPGKKATLGQFIPSDAIFIVSFDPTQNGLEELRDFSFLQTLGEIPVMRRFKNDLAFVTDSLLRRDTEVAIPRKVSASFHVTGSGTFDLLYVIELPGSWTEAWLQDQMSLHFLGETVQISRERIYESSTITELKHDGGRAFSYTVRDGFFLGSFTPFLVDDALRNYASRNRNDFIMMSEDELREAELTFYPYYIDRLVNVFTSNERKKEFRSLDRHRSPVMCKVNLSDDLIKLTGQAVNEPGDIFSCFNGQAPHSSKMPKILPVNTSFYLSYSFDDPVRFLDRLEPHISTIDRPNGVRSSIDLIEKLSLPVTDLFRNITGNEVCFAVVEPPVTSYQNNIVALVQLKDPESAITDLLSIIDKVDVSTGGRSESVNYRDKVIRRIKVPYLMSVVWGPLFDALEHHYFVVLDDHLVFGNSRYVLQYMIDAHKGQKTLETGDSYRKVNDMLASEGNIHCYVNVAKSWNVLRHHLSKAVLDDIKNYTDAVQGLRGFSFRFIHEDSLRTDFESALSFGTGDSSVATLLYAEQLDTSISSGPFIVDDPTGGASNIIVQDVSNTLYLLKNDGEISWRKQLNEAVRSDIYEVDYFSNGSRQYLFNTDEYLFLIDRAGNTVGNFPIRLPSTASAPLTLLRKSISDNRSLIYVPCDNSKVYAYLLNGKPLPGWSFISTEGVVRNSVAFKNEGEYSLLISDDRGNHFVTNILGEIRSEFHSTDILSIQNQAVPAIDNSGYKFYATTLSGGLLRVKGDGTFDEISLSIDGLDHGYTASDIDGDGSSEHVIVSGMEVMVYDSELVLKYRKLLDQHLSPSVQVLKYNEGSTLIAVRSVSGKTWLLDETGNILKGFPVKGNSKVDLGSLSEGNAPYLVTAGADGSVHIYSVK
jgi:hypothetical protein